MWLWVVVSLLRPYDCTYVSIHTAAVVDTVETNQSQPILTTMQGIFLKDATLRNVIITYIGEQDGTVRG